MHGKPASFAAHEYFRGKSVRARCPQLHGVVARGVGLNVLGLQPQRSASGFISIDKEGNPINSRDGAAPGVFQHPTVADQLGHNHGIGRTLRKHGRHHCIQNETYRGDPKNTTTIHRLPRHKIPLYVCLIALNLRTFWNPGRSRTPDRTSGCDQAPSAPLLMETLFGEKLAHAGQNAGASSRNGAGKTVFSKAWFG